jgi:transcriptional regulator with XRE-family HTH domain
MDDQRVGWALRAIRIAKQWRQSDLAERANVSRWVVMRIERGRLATVPLGKVRAVAAALDARIDTVVRWHGGDLGRLVNARHAAMHEAMAAFFAGLDGWMAEPEVSFSIFGERGIIDVLAWHPTRRILLVIELKTEIVDVNEMLGTLDRKERLAWQVARERGWDPVAVGSWLVLADDRSNRRSVARFSTVLRAKLPMDGSAMRAWLDDPSGPVRALGFLPNVQATHLAPGAASIQRVQRPKRTVPDSPRSKKRQDPA